MSAGLKIRRGSVVVFDSQRAVGGVCMGIFEITGPATTLSFPYMPPGCTPMVVYSDGATASKWRYDESLGYPRFSFPAVTQAGGNARRYVGVYLK